MEFLVAYLIYSFALTIALGRKGLRSGTTIRKESDEAPQKILVIGATGGTGRELVRQALERGYEVTAFVRTPSKFGIEHPKLRIMQGDVMDYDSVEAAVPGHDAVLSALGHKRYFGPSHILSEGTGNILQAMEKQGVRRFVCETSLGIGGSAGRMGLYYTFFTIPVILPFYFWDKCRQEQLIADSDTEWVIVRPGSLTNGPKRGEYRSGKDIGSFLWTVRISRVDVADFMLNQLTADTNLGRAVSLSY